MQLLFALLLAMVITVTLIPPLMQRAGWLGVLDRPDARKVHAQPIPRVGGIAMAVGILTALLIWGAAVPLQTAYCWAVLVLLIFGVLDDRLTLSPGWKFVGQVLVALIVMHFGQLNIEVVRHSSEHVLPSWLSLPLTLLFIVGVTNAINLADGLDGLAGGTTLLCMSGLALLGVTGGSMFVTTACLAVIGAVLGFLRYNTHPARVFMGDAGSQVLGFSAAVFSLALTQDKSLPYSAALPLLLLGMPMIDTLTVMTERVLDGKSPFKADRNHVHHRLLALGFNHHEAVMVVYLAQACLLVSAWYLRYASDLLIVLVFAAVSVSIVAVLRGARLHGWRWRGVADQAVAIERSWLTDRIEWLHADARLYRWSGYGAGVAIVVYAALVAINGVPASFDIRVLASAAAVVVLASIALFKTRQEEAGWLERAALYTSVLIAVFLDRQGLLEESLRCNIEYLVFGALALCIALRLRLSADRRFRVTSLDLLVLFIGLALPNLPGSFLSSYAAGWTVAKVLLLFYGIETLSVAQGAQWRVLTGGSLIFLAAVALRASA